MRVSDEVKSIINQLRVFSTSDGETVTVKVGDEIVFSAKKSEDTLKAADVLSRHLQALKNEERRSSYYQMRCKALEKELIDAKASKKKKKSKKNKQK